MGEKEEEKEEEGKKQGIGKTNLFYHDGVPPIRPSVCSSIKMFCFVLFFNSSSADRLKFYCDLSFVVHVVVFEGFERGESHFPQK